MVTQAFEAIYDGKVLRLTHLLSVVGKKNKEQIL
jgi:hypothetical protein